jgi:hypothetical protein
VTTRRPTFLLIVALFALLVTGCDAGAPATPPGGSACAPIELNDAGGRPIDLSGAWSGNDGGVYYLKQIDSCVWWSALSDFGGQEPGQEWVMSFRGTLDSEGVLRGEFVDVKGTNPGSGTITIEVRSEQREGTVVTELYRQTASGHTIGVTFWQRRVEPTDSPTDGPELPSPVETGLPTPEATGTPDLASPDAAPITLPPG